MELELLKAEFKSKFEKSNPVLAKLTLWCLNNEYEERPDFLDLQNQIEKIENALHNNHFISELLPMSSNQILNYKASGNKVETPKLKQDFFIIESPQNYMYPEPGRQT